MRLHVIGNLGVVGKATYDVLKLSGIHEITGSDLKDGKPEKIPGVDDNERIDAYFICVPEKKVESVLKQLNQSDMILGHSLHIVRSTLRPDIALEFAKNDSRLVVNPEFLKAHTSFWDCMFPRAILIGARTDKQADIVENIWSFLRVPVYRTGIAEANLLKLVSNYHGALVISYWNNVMELSKAVNANVFEIARILPRIDERVSRYGSVPGSAFGGFCLPKDVQQLVDMCEMLELSNGESDLLYTIQELNSRFTESTLARGSL